MLRRPVQGKEQSKLHRDCPIRRSLIIILHIVCWYPVLSGLVRLLVTPGGGGLAGIVVGSLMFAEVLLCLDHEKASRKGRTKDQE
ncbi:hypothetical protein KCU81_g198, partial [Aureobasidium melanogenum]